MIVEERMNITVSEAPEGVTIRIAGVMKKQDGMNLSEKITQVGKSKPKTIVLDFTNLAAVSLDSLPFLVSAVERVPVGKYKIKAIGANEIVKKSLRGAEFERVGVIE
jgi:anti-anti-sigma regulatory factor